MDFSNIKLKFIEHYSTINPKEDNNIQSLKSLKFFDFIREKTTLRFNPFKYLSSIKLSQIRELIAGYLILLLNNLDFYLSSFILLDLHLDFNIDLKLCSLIVTFGIIFRLLGTLIAIRLVRLIKKRPLLFILNFLLIAFYIISSRLGSFSGFIAIRCLTSLVFGIYSELGSLLITNSTKQNTAFAISNFSILSGPLSYIIVPAYIYILKTQFNWRQYYLIAAFIIFFTFIFILFSIENKFNQRTPNLKKITKKSLCYCRAHGALIYVTILSFGWNVLARSTLDLYPTLLRMRPDIAYNQFILGTCLSGLGALIGGLFLGFISPFIGHQRSLLLALITFFSSFMIYTYLPLTPIQSMVTMLFIQLFIQFGFSSLYYHIAKNFHPDHRGAFPRVGTYIGMLFASVSLQIELVIGEALGDFEKGELYYELVQFWMIVFASSILVICCIISGWNVFPDLTFVGAISPDQEHEDHTFVQSEEISIEKNSPPLASSTNANTPNGQLLTINNTELPSTSSNMLGLDFL